MEESQPQAAALGSKTDASRVDQSRYIKFSPGQSCSSCALYQGVPGSYAGGCALFAGKQVMSNGWCSAYARKVCAYTSSVSKPLDPPPVMQGPTPHAGVQSPADQGSLQMKKY